MDSVRKLLAPFSLLYSGITGLRNKLYDEEILSSEAFDLPVICVGNLSVGGTGKSPMVAYLISLLKDDYRIATLSRGYKRSTKGFRLVSGNEKAAEVGDEPLQFKSSFPEVIVAVDEVRTRGIKELLKQSEKPEVIILDDAFQHRKVTAGFNILLTPYNDLYSDDMLLPAGNLREPKRGAKRAQAVVVTKCPAHLSQLEMDLVKRKLDLFEGQELFFSTIIYSDNIFSSLTSFPLEKLKEKKITLVTGIANPGPLVEYMALQGLNFEHLRYPDHHNFSDQEIESLNRQEWILTTEKDYMRLKGKISEEKLFYLPITTGFVEGKARFDKMIRAFVSAAH